ncbi:hypothetical protein ACFFRR_003102 [Megaselia abdita]
MCENLRNSRIAVKDGHSTFDDSLWSCLENPREARAVFRRRVDDNRQFLPCGTKSTAAPKQVKRSLGLEIKPIKTKRRSVKELQVSKKPRLSTAADGIDQTITLNGFNPPIASTPAPFLLTNVNDTHLQSISEVVDHKTPEKSLQQSKIPVLSTKSPLKTPRRGSLINPVALRAILQNAEQYTPRKTPQKKACDVGTENIPTNSPPRDLSEFDVRVRSLKTIEKSNVQDCSLSGKSPVSIIEIFDSTVEEDSRRIVPGTPKHNENDNNTTAIPDTPCPNHVLNKTVPENDITIPETQEVVGRRSKKILESEKVLESQNILESEDVLESEGRLSQQVLDLRLRRSQSVPKAIDLRTNRTRTSRRLSESALYESMKETPIKTGLSQSLHVQTFVSNCGEVLEKDTNETGTIEKSVSTVNIQRRVPCESEAPRALEVIAEVDINPSGEEANPSADEIEEAEGQRHRSVTPLTIKPVTDLTTPQILKKIDEDLRQLLVAEKQIIIEPPTAFIDETEAVDASNLLNESITGTARLGQFQKVQLRKSGEFPAPIESKQDEGEVQRKDYLKTVRETQRNAKRRKKRTKQKRNLYHEDSDIESNTESFAVKRSPGKLARIVNENMNRPSDVPSRKVTEQSTRLSRVRRSITFASQEVVEEVNTRVSRSKSRTLQLDDRKSANTKANVEEKDHNQEDSRENKEDENKSRRSSRSNGVANNEEIEVLPEIKNSKRSANCSPVRWEEEKRSSQKVEEVEKNMRKNQSVSCSPMHNSHLKANEPAIEEEKTPVRKGKSNTMLVEKNPLPKNPTKKVKAAKAKQNLTDEKSKKNEDNENIRQRPTRNRKPPGAFWCHGRTNCLSQPSYTPIRNVRTKKPKITDTFDELRESTKKVRKAIAVPVEDVPSKDDAVSKPGTSGKENQKETKQKRGKRPKTKKTEEGLKKDSQTGDNDHENPTSVVVAPPEPVTETEKPSKARNRSKKSRKLNAKKNRSIENEENPNNFEFAVPVLPPPQNKKKKKTESKSKRPSSSEATTSDQSSRSSRSSNTKDHFHSTPNHSISNPPINASKLLDLSKQMSKQNNINAVFDQLSTLSSIENSAKSSEGTSSSTKSSEMSSNLNNRSNWIEKLKTQKLDAEEEAQAFVRDEVMCVEDLAFTQDRNMVEYAYYKSGENQRIGYIRLQPKVVKKMCRAKQNNLDFLVMNGAVTFTIDKSNKDLKEGDLCSVLRNSKYEIRNRSSDDIAMIMIVKPIM